MYVDHKNAVCSSVTAFSVQMFTMVVSVGLVEAFRVDEAQAVLLWWQSVQGGGAVRQVGHQGVIPIAHPHLTLERRQLLGDFSLIMLNQQCWRKKADLNTRLNILCFIINIISKHSLPFKSVTKFFLFLSIPFEINILV